MLEEKATVDSLVCRGPGTLSKLHLILYTDTARERKAWPPFRERYKGASKSVKYFKFLLENVARPAIHTEEPTEMDDPCLFPRGGYLQSSSSCWHVGGNIPTCHWLTATIVGRQGVHNYF